MAESEIANGDWQNAQPDETRSVAEAQPDEAPLARMFRWATATNIAKDLSDERLGTIGRLVKEETEIDERSRDDWKTAVEKALAFAKQDSKPKSYPWPGASNVVYPLMTTAAMQFAARAYPAIIANRSVVKGVVQGKDDGVPAPQMPQAPMGQMPGGPMGQVSGMSGQMPPSNPMPGMPGMGAAPMGRPGPGPGPMAAMGGMVPGGPPPQQWLVPPGALQARADRIGSHMSWQLLDEMPEWEPETDRLCHQLPIVGTLFRKSFFDPAARRNKSLLVGALKLIVNYWAKSLELAPRVTEELEFYPYEIKEFERAGLWLEHQYQASVDRGTDKDASIIFYEQHRWLDLDDDGFPEPYTVTIDKEGAQVVRIVARFEPEGVHIGPDSDGDDAQPRVVRIDPLQFYTQYDFLPSLDGGIYGTGFGQLLGPINASVNTTLNMLIDAGHLANTNGGFVAKNLSMQSGALRWTMGEFKPVNAGGMSLRDSILPLPFSGPSQVLFALLGTLIDAGKDVASVKDVLAGEQPQANVPATTVLALIEQGQKVFTAIFKRIHRSLKSELKKLYRLNRLYLADSVDFQIDEEWMHVSRADYEAGAGVTPISDPTMVSEAQQLGRAQYLMQFRGDPLIQQPELTRRLLKAAAIDDVDKLMNPKPPMPPQMVVKQAEMALQHREIKVKEAVGRAQALQAITQAALNLAKADSEVGAAHLAWVEQHMRGMELEFEQMIATQEAANAGASEDGSAPGAAGPVGP